MIIPNGTSEEYKTGDIVILLKDYSNEYAIFTKGHEFEYVDKNDYGYILKDGNIIIEGRMDFTLKISYEQAIKEINDRADMSYFKKFLNKNCLNVFVGYEDRDIYDGCKIKQKDKKTYDDSCTPSSDCVKYVKLDKRCLKYLRKLKLNEINDNE